MSENEPENAHMVRAYEFIREKILSGAYSPGRRLQTLVLAAEIGVSRTPVRDALRELNTEGLVEIRPRLGASVRSVKASEAKELWELRLALESFSAELAARNWQAEDMVEIEDAFTAMERLVQALDQSPESAKLLEQLVEQDIRFHFAILRAAGNRLIRDEIRRLHLLDRVMRIHIERLSDAAAPVPVEPPQKRRHWVLECHRKILQAIKSRDPEAARQSMQEHIREMVDRSVLAIARAEKRLDSPELNRSELLYAPYG